jgi:dTDP-4-amino-4,6-dideoxygalactose transaminase
MSTPATARLAIDGGRPVHPGPWPAWPQWDAGERRALLDVLESGAWWFGGRGEELGRRFARLHGARHGIAVTNGSQAAEIVLRALGIGPGDEVVVPPYTFVATATAVLAVDAVPVFADIDPTTLNLDPHAVERALTPRTRAIMPVHFAGLPADMDALGRIARRNRLRVVEDACHAWGSQWRGGGVGTLGSAGVFSFQYSKNLTAGEGGMIVTDSTRLAEVCRSLRHCGRPAGRRAEWYEHERPGGNHRMTEFQAALLLAQLRRFGAQFRTRRRNAALLHRGLGGLPGIGLVADADPRVTRRSYHLYVFRYLAEGRGGWPRARFLRALAAEGIPCSAGYPEPLYRLELFRPERLARHCPFDCPRHEAHVDYGAVRCPEAERLCREAVWLPQRLLLGSREEMRDVVDAVAKVLAAMGRRA